MSAPEDAARVRRAAGLFRLEQRGVGVVSGGDRIRWLDGMVSNDVASLEAGPERSGCYAALLTPQGRIVSDLQILLRPEALWIETERAALPAVLARLEKYVIADDVVLRDASAELARLGIEGPRAPAILEAALGRAPEIAPDSGIDAELAGVSIVVAAFGWSGAPAFQIYAPAAAAQEIAERLRQVGRSEGLVEAGAEALEILRIEAGVPRQGAELDEEVLPAEAQLERAVSTTKGCYTGQEVVARLRTRGQVKHRPKDGPSAGITIATALISALTGTPSRTDVAMTGEITLRGRVLAVGGVKEKAVAALREGLTKVLLPAANAPELELMPEEVTSGLEFVPVRTMDEVLTEALTSMPKAQRSFLERGSSVGTHLSQ